ncbi:hypothetical protein CLAVI_000953 [Candidatus Clavichlamydia salmonicola]|uniref:hypothetical protein n=1 Tax=Candidatus Clavichlamydia salmonicola TaxID=469812 RepID=UPI001891C496|nr:hypothetical protein [Candidatus Clavichlamydia salmonicola]MBF5051312.1 hypothetical protein [Candidatus Clavichlamydia salmonicola]
MISNNFKLPFCFKLPSSPSEALRNIKNNLLFLKGISEIILSEALSYLTSIDAASCFYRASFISPYKASKEDLLIIPYIQRDNQTFLISTPIEFCGGSNSLMKEAKVGAMILGVGSALLIIVGVVQVFFKGREIYKLSCKKLLLKQNFLLNKGLETPLQKEEKYLDIIKLFASSIGFSGGLTLAISGLGPGLCNLSHQAFSKYHCVSLSQIMQMSSMLYLTQAGLLLCLKAYGPSKKETIFLKLEQRHGVRGIIKKSDQHYLCMEEEVKIIIDEAEDEDDIWVEASSEVECVTMDEWKFDDEEEEEVFYLAKEVSIKDFYNPKRGPLANKMLQEERDKLRRPSAQMSHLNNLETDKNMYPLIVDAFFDEGPYKTPSEEEVQMKIVKISMSEARNLQSIPIPFMVFGQRCTEFTDMKQQLENDLKGLCASLKERMIKAFLGRRGLLRSRVIERAPCKALKSKAV